MQGIVEAGSEQEALRGAGDRISESNPLLSIREWASPENAALFLICMADMISTLYWVHIGAAVEDNPVFARWLASGDGVFVGMKFASFMPLIAVSTYYRRRRPRLIKWSMRLTVLVYVAAYVAKLLPQLVAL